MGTRGALYLASASPSRRRLLNEARIPFIITEHQCDERAVQEPGELHAVVLHLACCKASMAVLPETGSQEAPVFVLAADTLVSDLAGTLYAGLTH